MAGGASTYVANLSLDNVLGNTTFAANVYISLLSTLPAAGGAGLVEITAGGFGRVSVANNDTNWPDAENGIKRNAVAIEFGEATADLPSILGAAVYDASSGGNLLFWGPFSTPHTVLDEQTFTIPALGGTFRGI
jgi:hypothetical protein